MLLLDTFMPLQLAYQQRGLLKHQITHKEISLYADILTALKPGCNRIVFINLSLFTFYVHCLHFYYYCLFDVSWVIEKMTLLTILKAGNKCSYILFSQYFMIYDKILSQFKYVYTKFTEIYSNHIHLWTAKGEV